MSIALDIGASGLRSLFRNGPVLRGRNTPAFYVVLPEQPPEQRLLQQLCVPFSTCDGSYVVFGRHAIELAQSLKLPLIPVLPGGRLPEGDPLGRQVAATLVEALIPSRGIRAGSAGLILPGNPEADAENALLGFIQRLLALRGYRPCLVHAGRACVLAELEDQGFQGIGLSVGAACSSLCIARGGRSLAECTVARGCNHIDEAFARSRGRFLFDSTGNKYLNLPAVTNWRTSTPIDLTHPRDEDEDLLVSLCREWMMTVFRALGEELHEAGGSLRMPSPLVLVISGGPARMSGFDKLAAEALNRVDLPIRVSEVRSGRPSDFNHARGCMIATELEGQAAARSA